MAYQFDGVDDYIEGGSAPVTAPAMTLAAWFKLDSVAVDGTIMSIGVNGGTHRLQMFTASHVGDKLAANSVAAATAKSAVSGTLATGVWYHGAAVFTSTASRMAYLDGTAGTINTNASTPSGLNRVNIGSRWSTTIGNFFPGAIAEAAVWNAALTAEQIASLAKGFSPDQIRPLALRFYAPLIREAIDIRGGVTLTVSGSTASNHPRIIQS